MANLLKTFELASYACILLVTSNFYEDAVLNGEYYKCVFGPVSLVTSTDDSSTDDDGDFWPSSSLH